MFVESCNNQGVPCYNISVVRGRKPSAIAHPYAHAYTIRHRTALADQGCAFRLGR